MIESYEYQHDRAESLQEISPPNSDGIRRLSEAKDVMAIAKLALLPIRHLEQILANREPLDPQAAVAIKGKLDSLLDVLECVCENRRIRFPEALAYLSPVEDLLVALSLAAERKQNLPPDLPEGTR